MVLRIRQCMVIEMDHEAVLVEIVDLNDDGEPVFEERARVVM